MKKLTAWQCIKLVVELIIIFGFIQLLAFLSGALPPTSYEWEKERIRNFLEQTPLHGHDYTIVFREERPAPRR